MLNTILGMVRMVALLHTVDTATVDMVEGTVARVCTVDACDDVRTVRGPRGLHEGRKLMGWIKL